MSNPSRLLKSPWPLLITLLLVVITIAVAVALHFKAKNDQIRNDLGLKPGESYEDVINGLEKADYLCEGLSSASGHTPSPTNFRFLGPRHKHSQGNQDC